MSSPKWDIPTEWAPNALPPLSEGEKEILNIVKFFVMGPLYGAPVDPITEAIHLETYTKMLEEMSKEEKKKP